jgi:RNA polymerase sigma factor (sigma-70 family)
MPNLSDQEIVQRLTANRELSDETIEYLWKDQRLRKTCYAVMKRILPSDQDLDEIFDDSLITFRKAVIQGTYTFRGSVHSFIAGICKMLSLKRYRDLQKSGARLSELKESDLQSAAENTDPFLSMADLESHSASASLLDSFLAQLSDTCKESLHLYYFQEYTIRDIAFKKGQNDQSVKNTLHRCRETLRGFIMARPEAVSILKSNLYAGL